MTDIIKSKFLSDLPGVAHGFGVGACEIDDMVGDGLRIFDTNQVHGCRVVRLRREDQSKKIEADAFITNEPGIVCHVRTADCVPILIADTKRRAVAAVHAGWRGTALGVAAEALREMDRAYGTDPADCVAAIGPCICGPCYEVGREVIEALQALAIGDVWRVDERHVDLGAANLALLKNAGVKEIEALENCTACEPRFASWRRDGSKHRQINYILIGTVPQL